MILVAEHKWHVEGVDVGHQRAHYAEGNTGQLNGVQLDLFKDLLLSTQYPAGKHLHRDFAFRFRFQLLAHALDGDYGWRTLWLGVRGFQRQGLSEGGKAEG
ncbi:hypothetical protein D9M68_514210 [compost metagenome]